MLVEESSSPKVKPISPSEKISESFKSNKIRLEKLHSKSYRNKHFENCLLLLHTIDLLTSVKIYNYNQGKEGDKITLGEIMEFFNASLKEVYDKYWEVYFKVVLHKKDLDEAGYSHDERTIINRLNWLVFFGYLDKFKKEGFGSDEVFYVSNDRNTYYNNFLSDEYLVRLTEDQRKKLDLIPYFPIKLEDLELTEEDRKLWEEMKKEEEDMERDENSGKSMEYMRKKYGNSKFNDVL